ncbi:hypothetical protein K3725_16685 [Leisingera sp. S132]|uniref:hypothetical protein n=1 Tax=Leisingera sp. S132 TaxID=2867016 RepID=UPI0021A62FF4|nr:hypothetical protein [Leisingera sp. S132]UWQ78924.1 hypothetical protein K3725_16685 [Leisingera sp. S132]
MAWFSALFGVLGGLVLAVAAGTAGGWPVWLIVLVYPFAAAFLMLGMLALQLWRSGSSGGEEDSTGKSSGPGAKQREQLDQF